MNTIKSIIISILLSGLMSACGGGDKSAAATENTKQTTSDKATITNTSESPKDGVVAIVNGKEVLEKNFKAYVKQRKAGKPENSKISMSRLLDEYINFELALQDAENKGLQNNDKVKTELENQRRTLLVNAAFENYVKNNPLTEEQMRKDYESRMSELTLTEYKLRHILLTNSDDATTVANVLKNGADFMEMVKKYSTGPSASEGGLLGWQSEFDILPEFREPLGKLKKGQHSPTPIKTRFGWHILYLDDVRVNPPPAFEEVKDRVKVVLQRRQVEDYFLKLRTTAKIKVIDFNDDISNIPQHKGINIDNYSNN